VRGRRKKVGRGIVALSRIGPGRLGGMGFSGANSRNTDPPPSTPVQTPSCTLWSFMSHNKLSDGCWSQV